MCLISFEVKVWRRFVSIKQGDIIAFLDNLMNNVLY